AASWVASLNSPHSRRNCERTASRFLAALGGVRLRQATVEDVREALTTITAGLAPTSAGQIVLRVKSLLSYGHRLGYLQFNAGAVIKVQGDTRPIAQRIVCQAGDGSGRMGIQGSRRVCERARARFIRPKSTGLIERWVLSRPGLPN